MDVGNGPQDPARPERQTKIEDLVPAFLIGAADADEAAAVLRHAGDPQVAGALAAYGELADALLLAVPPAEPSPVLGSKLRAALGYAPGESVTWGAPPGSAAETPAAAAQPADAGASAGPSAPVLAPARRAWHWPLAAAVAAAALLLLLNLYWLREISALRQSQAALEQQLRQQADQFMVQMLEQENILQRQQEQIAQQDEVVGSLVVDMGERYAMQAVEPGSPAFANVAWLESANLAVLRAEELPVLEYGWSYQLWLIRGDTRTSGGVFSVDEDGCGTLVFYPTESLEAYDGMGITREPYGGSAAPTAPPVVRAQL